MTIEKTTRFQNDLRQLFEKYKIEGGGCFFVHDDTVHMVEAHGVEKNQWVVAIMDALGPAISATNPNIPFVNYNSNQQQ
jgi:hypothetical protein